MADTRLALVGAGAMGRIHLRSARETAGLAIAWIVDPDPATRAVAEEFGAEWMADVSTLLDRERPDGAIVAVPNALHVSVATEFVAAGIPVLVEKPIADNLRDAEHLTQEAERDGVALLVGHHRRYNPIVARARAVVRDGALGRLVAASVLAARHKPGTYFEKAWRREPGGGPVLINLVHEIDMLRFICGEIASVQAVTSHAQRNLVVEDGAAVLLRFASGALGTILLSDSAATPWSWDLAAGENPLYPQQGAESCFLMGTEASLSLPGLTFWRGRDEPVRVNATPRDPYVEQLRHFAAVVQGREKPAVTGADACRSLAATLAIRDSAPSGLAVAMVNG
jgi:predicted dehydrogenase